MSAAGSRADVVADGDVVSPETVHYAAPPLPPGRARLVVAGFMGTGKTTAGACAAALLGLPFFDLDAVVERRAGRTVARTFAEQGESEFRRLERQAVADAARLSGAVVAPGGGAVLDRASFSALADGAVNAVLTATAEEIERRIGQDTARPLLDGEPGPAIRALLRARLAAYAAAGEPLATSGRTPEEVAAELAGRYRRQAPAAGARIRIAGPKGEYAVVVRQGALDDVGEELRRALPSCTGAVVVADAAVAGEAAVRVAESIAAAGLPAGEVVVIPGGEAAKGLATVAALWERLRGRGLDRGGAVVAVGGGAALDAIGFAAATYARGVALLNVPTTVLAMVDAGLGGKVAVDHAGVKNAAGAFHHPVAVVVDTSAAATQPPRERRAGLAEAVKMAVLASPLVLDALEDAELDGDRLPRTLAWHVEQAVRIKAAYVSADPEDTAARLSLNLGHTYAHAIESASGYGIAHGEAVSIGLVAAARLGESLGITTSGLAERLRALLPRLGLPIAAPHGLAADDLLRALGADKKRRGGRLRFVVPAPGGAALVGVAPGTALAALDA